MVMRIKLDKMGLTAGRVFLLLFFTIIPPYIECDVCSMCQCNNTTRAIDCSKRNLTFVPDNSFHNTILLNLSLNSLGHLHDASFQSYPNLQVLDLSNSGLTKLTENVFKGLSSLTKLNLSMNEQIPFTNCTTPVNLFSGLNSLTELKIMGTTVAFQDEGKGYPNTAFAKLPNLNDLWIDGLKGISFGEEFRTMKSLKSISLRGDLTIIYRFCYQPHVNRTILENLINLEQFTMRRCAIKYIEEDSFSAMIQLREVDLSSNFLLSLDGVLNACVGLSNSSRLEILRINNIDDIRGSCGIWVNKNMTLKLAKLNNLKEVHLVQNKLNGFEKGAMKYLPKSIETVDVKMNFFDFGFYALELGELSNLKRIDVSFNHFPDPTAIWHQHDFDDSTQPNTPEVEPGKTIKLRKDCSKTIKQQGKDCSSKKINYGLFDSYVPKLFLPNNDGNLQTDVVNNDEENDSDRKYICPRQISIPPEVVTTFLPKNIEHIDLSHSKLAHPIPEFFFDDDNSVVSINASASMLYCWDGPVHGLKRLRYLDLSSNMCKQVKKSFFDAVPTLRFLSISNNVLTDIIQNDQDGRLLKHLTALEQFDMSMNRLEKIPKLFLIHQSNLTTLNISHNALRDFDMKIDHFLHLQQVDLSHNYITTISEEMRQHIETISESHHHKTTKPLELNLDMNDIHCFCNNLDFLKWVYDHMSTCRFLDVKVTSCIYDNNERVLIDNRNDLGLILNDLNEKCRSYTGIVAASSVSFAVFAIAFASVIGYRLRWKVTYWYYVKSRDLAKPRLGYYAIDDSSTSTYKFDIYVSSLENMRSSVLDDMKKAFENEEFKVFFQDDDIVPGQNMYCKIANAIHVSRVVVFIVSDYCDEEREWRIAMRMAHEESLRRGYPIYFGVFIGNSPNVNDSEDIRELRHRKHLMYPGNMQPENSDTFWEDLVRFVNDIAGNEVISLTG